jgi:hypothetical protein
MEIPFSTESNPTAAFTPVPHPPFGSHCDDRAGTTSSNHSLENIRIDHALGYRGGDRTK